MYIQVQTGQHHFKSKYLKKNRNHKISTLHWVCYGWSLHFLDSDTMGDKDLVVSSNQGYTCFMHTPPWVHVVEQFVNSVAV